MKSKEYSVVDFVGKKVFIQTVTYHYTGLVVMETEDFFVLEQSAWIADSGRFADFLRTGIAEEVEPIGKNFVSKDSIVNIIEFDHELPNEQK